MFIKKKKITRHYRAHLFNRREIWKIISIDWIYKEIFVLFDECQTIQITWSRNDNLIPRLFDWDDQMTSERTNKISQTNKVIWWPRWLDDFEVTFTQGAGGNGHTV